MENKLKHKHKTERPEDCEQNPHGTPPPNPDPKPNDGGSGPSGPPSGPIPPDGGGNAG